MVTNIEIREIPATHARPLVEPLYELQGRGIQINDSDIFFVAFKENNVLGSVRYCLDEGTPMLRTMRVDKTLQRQGIGIKLLEAFADFLERNRIRNVYCVPYTHLKSFYAHIGFSEIPIEEVPKFLQLRLEEYKDKNMDVICMKRE